MVIKDESITSRFDLECSFFSQQTLISEQLQFKSAMFMENAMTHGHDNSNAMILLSTLFMVDDSIHVLRIAIE